MRLAALCALLLALAAPAFAADAPPVDELTAAKIKMLMLERELIRARAEGGQCAAVGAYDAKGKAIEAAVSEAAKAVGLDPATSWPDVEKRTWGTR
jgi:hypothetical protein